jgi:NADPH-dependent ferric siderophore reductase
VKGTPLTTTEGWSNWLIDRVSLRTEVTQVEQVRPRIRRIRFANPDLSNVAWTPGQQVRVMVSGSVASSIVRGQLRDLVRTYSVFGFDRDAGTLDLCIFDHGEAPGVTWSRRVAVGDEVAIRRPEGSLVLHDAPYQVFIGEETAQVAFGAMLAALPLDQKVLGVMEIGYPDARLDLPRGHELTWSYRGEAPATGSVTLLDAVRQLDLPDMPAMAYIAGEARTCAAVRRHLVTERGWPGRGSVIVKPFWAHGKRGLQ